MVEYKDYTADDYYKEWLDDECYWEEGNPKLLLFIIQFLFIAIVLFNIYCI